jgi:uncharacterized membrane protein YwzB
MAEKGRVVQSRLAVIIAAVDISTSIQQYFYDFFFGF